MKIRAPLPPLCAGGSGSGDGEGDGSGSSGADGFTGIALALAPLFSFFSASAIKSSSVTAFKKYTFSPVRSMSITR